MYILLTRISNVTFNPQLVLFDRLPCHQCIYINVNYWRHYYHSSLHLNGNYVTITITNINNIIQLQSYTIHYNTFQENDATVYRIYRDSNKSNFPYMILHIYKTKLVFINI